MKIIAMIPARMGSVRLPKKNLRLLGGLPLIARAIRKCKKSASFDEVWVNSEHPSFQKIAEEENVHFHRRSKKLADNHSTSEDFVADFLTHHSCDYLVQVHSIAPLLSTDSIKSFVSYLKLNQPDALMSVELIQLEALFENKPINFTFEQKTNSQDLLPVQRVSWSITAWKRETFLQAVQSGKCATYSGNIEYYPVNAMASHVIKTEQDLKIAEALLPLIDNS